MSDSDRSPVIIGVGEVCDRPTLDDDARTTPQIIAAAIRASVLDTGVTEILRMVDSLWVVDALSREDRSVPLHLEIATILDVAPRQQLSSASPSGNFPIRFLNNAANAIATGEVEIALIAGGEAMRTFTRTSERRGANGTQVIGQYRANGEEDLAQRYGFRTPMDVYPLYEQATRHAWHQSFHEAQAESGAIWASNAQVAARNSYAWIRDGRSGHEIITPAARNPMLAYPYTRSMVANSGVNQSAAVIVTSVGRARALGVAADRMVHVGYGAAADEAPGNLDRESFVSSPAMQVALRRTLDFNGLVAADLDLVELYSCFPCVPKMARRVIGWPLDRPHSIYGGLTFGGGPIGNCMTHAVAALTRRIRSGSRNGLIFANGGFATKNHAIVLTRDAPPGGRIPKSYDVQNEADVCRGPLPKLVDGFAGTAAIETFAVPYSKDGPQHANVLARTSDNRRVIARVSKTSRATIEWLTSPSSEPVGAIGTTRVGDDGLTYWGQGSS